MKIDIDVVITVAIIIEGNPQDKALDLSKTSGTMVMPMISLGMLILNHIEGSFVVLEVTRRV